MKRFLVDIGDKIEGPRYDDQGRLLSEGQILAELSIPELQAELRQKQALVGQATAEVKQAAATVAVAEAAFVSAEAKLTENIAGIERDQAQYERWKSELGRITDLADKGSRLRAKLQDGDGEPSSRPRTRRVENPLRRSSPPKRSLRKVEQPSSRPRPIVTRPMRDRRVAEADEQRKGTPSSLWSYATIRAPYDGTVTARNALTPETSFNPEVAMARNRCSWSCGQTPSPDHLCGRPGNRRRPDRKHP